MIASLVLALAFQFGEPAPLTNTRYAPVDAAGTLASNGSEFLFFWTHGGRVRVSAIRDGEALMGRAILSGTEKPSVVWTGDRFLVASGNLLRVLNARGEPAGDPIVISPFADRPRLATNGRTIVLTARTPASLRAWLLDGGGRPIGAGIALDARAEAAIASNGDGYAVVSIPVSGSVRVTMLDANGALRSQQTVDTASPVAPAIASDGHDYLAIWSLAGGTGSAAVRARPISANGAVHPMFTVATAAAPRRIEGSAVVWAGDHYAIACASGAERFDLAYIFNASTLEKTTLEGASSFSPSLASAGGRLLAAWGTAGGTMIRELGSWSDSSFPAAWAATGQFLLNAVSSSKGTLVVWRETIDAGRWYAGMRGHDGSWVERQLPGNNYQLAATSGEGFVLVDSATVTRLNASGVPLVGTTQLPFTAQAVAWNGRAYVLAGVRDGAIFIATLDGSGALSPISVIHPQDPTTIAQPRLASDGTNVLLVWLSGPPFRIDGTLLDRELRERTPERFLIEPRSFSAGTTEVAWDGARYVIVTNEDGLHAFGVSREGVPDHTPVTFTTRFVRYFSIARAGDGIGVVWPDVNGPGTSLQDNLRILDRGGSVTALAPFPRNEDLGSQQLVALPANRIGYLSTRTSEPEPHFAAQRVAMAIAEPSSQPRVANAPRITAMFEGESAVRVSWTVPALPVNGYRLEYQIGDDEWLELDRWFAAQETTYAIALARRRSTPYRFRVRAWNDAGVSAYSQPAAVSYAKRRAVR